MCVDQSFEYARSFVAIFIYLIMNNCSLLAICLLSRLLIVYHAWVVICYVACIIVIIVIVASYDNC